MPSYLSSTFCCWSSAALIICFICSHRPGFFVVFVVRSACAPFRLHGYHIGRRTYHQRVHRPFACLALPSSFCWLVHHFDLAHGAQFHTTCVQLRPTLTAFPLQPLLRRVFVVVVLLLLLRLRHRYRCVVMALQTTNVFETLPQ